MEGTRDTMEEIAKVQEKEQEYGNVWHKSGKQGDKRIKTRLQLHQQLCKPWEGVAMHCKCLEMFKHG